MPLLCHTSILFIFVPQLRDFLQSEASKSVGNMALPTLFESLLSKVLEPQRCYPKVLK